MKAKVKDSLSAYELAIDDETVKTALRRIGTLAVKSNESERNKISYSVDEPYKCATG